MFFCAPTCKVIMAPPSQRKYEDQVTHICKLLICHGDGHHRKDGKKIPMVPESGFGWWQRLKQELHNAR